MLRTYNRNMGSATSSNPSDNQDVIYYGVYIPKENSNSCESEDQSRVYTDKNKALIIIKEKKKGRFRSFKTYAEAKIFSCQGDEQSSSSTSSSSSSSSTIDKQPTASKRNTGGEEKVSNFKAPKHEDIMRFRKFIENGDLAAVKQVVWENPRYLINSGDTPAILQEGSRYNALHVAVRASCRANMCELILSTVGNPEFVRLLDGEGDYSNHLNRSQILVDLYLNTPDKGLNETPLHFAVKFGLKEVAQVLVSYPQCLKTVKNKYNEIPAEIICSRKCQEDELLKREILALLDEQFYVPVIRSEDNTTQPLIGDLFSPTRPLTLNTDPISPRVEVFAVAGPMSKNQAVEFRRKWKTPPRIRNTPTKRLNLSFDDSYTTNSPLSNTIYRLQDTEKGLERVGRDLAKEYHVAWKEYWPFLNAWADLTSEEGLSKLEQFLEQRFKRAWIQSAEEMETEETMNEKDSENIFELNSLCKQMSFSSLDRGDNWESNEFCSSQRHSFGDMNDSDEENEFYTPPSSPRSTCSSSDENMYTALQGNMTFIQGDTPSKFDYAVHHAISSIELNPNLHPNVYRWHHQLQLIMQNESSRFNTPIFARKRLPLSPIQNCVKTLNYN